MDQNIHNRFLVSLRYGFAALAALFFLTIALSSQEVANVIAPASSSFQVGEKLTYTLSFKGYTDSGFAEVYVASRGKLGGRDVIELRSRIKTTGVVNAALYAIDESRTTFISTETGLPLLVKKTVNVGVMPKEAVTSFLDSPAVGHDLLALIYKIRESGGTGSYTLQENGGIYAVTAQVSGNEPVKTDAGQYTTSISNLQSTFFTDNGIENLRVNISQDDKKIPVLIRFKTAKGEVHLTLSGIQIVEPEPETVPTPTPVVIPRLSPTPRPSPTPTPYIDNQPLLPELGFDIGETLDYRISSAGRQLATFSLQVKERKQFMGEDSVLLAGTITSAEQGNGVFATNDFIRAQVNPDTLAPKQIEIRFGGGLSSLNQTVMFDQKIGAVTFGANHIDTPIGTHSILSLLYALRSFNLKPSKDINNPVNDTRVAVFWASKAYIFTLRPSNPEMIEINGEKVSAQQIAVNTGVPQLDQLAIKVWLSNDDRRIPLRFSVGSYQADIISFAEARTK